jgi:hypothetical protein
MPTVMVNCLRFPSGSPVPRLYSAVAPIHPRSPDTAATASTGQSSWRSCFPRSGNGVMRS